MPTTEPASFQNPGLLASNSTSEPLSANGQFVGGWSNVAYFAAIVVSIHAEFQGSLFLEFTEDDTNSNATWSELVVNPGIESYTIRRSASYFRVRYLNNGRNEDSFVLQCFADHGRNVSDANDVIVSNGEKQATLISKNTATGLSTVDSEANNLLRCIDDKFEKLLNKIDLFFS